MIKSQNLGMDLEIDHSLDFKNIEHLDAFIPNRNILMATMANSKGYNNIWIGGSKSDRVCDNSEKVFERLSEFLTNMNRSFVKIDSPFWDCHKENMIRWYMNFHDPSDLITKTFSCFTPIKLHKSTSHHLIFEPTCVPDKAEYKTKECLQCSACFRKCCSLWGGAKLYIPFKDPVIISRYYKEFINIVVENPRSIGVMSYIKKWLSEGNSL